MFITCKNGATRAKYFYTQISPIFLNAVLIQGISIVFIWKRMVSAACAAAQGVSLRRMQLEQGVCGSWGRAQALLCPAGAAQLGGVRGRAAALGGSPLLPAGQPEIQGHPCALVSWLLHKSCRDVAQVKVEQHNLCFLLSTLTSDISFYSSIFFFN